MDYFQRNVMLIFAGNKICYILCQNIFSCFQFLILLLMKKNVIQEVTEFSLSKSGLLYILFTLFQKGFGDKLKVENGCKGMK